MVSVMLDGQEVLAVPLEFDPELLGELFEDGGTLLLPLREEMEAYCPHASAFSWFLEEELRDQLLGRGYSFLAVDVKGLQPWGPNPFHRPVVHPSSDLEVVFEELFYGGAPVSRLFTLPHDPSLIWEEGEVEWGTVPSPEELNANQARAQRFEGLCAWLAFMVKVPDLEGKIPPLVRSERGWRFVDRYHPHKLADRRRWVAVSTYKAWRAAYLEALWAFVWWRRRHWLRRQTVLGDVLVNGAPACLLSSRPRWLSQEAEMAIRRAFKRLAEVWKVDFSVLERYRALPADSLEWVRGRLEALRDLEARALTRAKALAAAGQLDEGKAAKAVAFFEEIFSRQERLLAWREYEIRRRAVRYYGSEIMADQNADLEELEAELLQLD